MKKALSENKRIMRLHIFSGVPLAAFFHSFLQFSYEINKHNIDDLWLFPVHFGLGVLFGSVILVPAYALQAMVFIFLRANGGNRSTQIMFGGLLQAVFVSLYAMFVGIEPSLKGNFPLTFPMIMAGFFCGSIVAVSTTKKFYYNQGCT